MDVLEEMYSIARSLVASSGRGKRHHRSTSKGKAKYRKLKSKGSFRRQRAKYQKKWRKTKGRSAPSSRKHYR